MKPRLQRLFEEYTDAHQHPTNQLTHKIAIPMIVFHIVAMLDWVKFTPLPGLRLSLALPAYLGTVAWYLSLDLRLGLIMAGLYALCFPLAWVTPWPLVLAIALLGWLIQLAGHVLWEKRSPAFVRNLVQALVGPIYFVAILLGDWPAQTYRNQAQAADRQLS